MHNCTCIICVHLGLVPIHTHVHTVVWYGLSIGPTEGLSSWWLRNRSPSDSQQQLEPNEKPNSFCIRRKQFAAILEPIAGLCPNQCQQRNSVQLVLDHPCSSACMLNVTLGFMEGILNSDFPSFVLGRH